MSDIRQVMYDIERCICHVPDACKDCSKYKGMDNLKCMKELMADAYTLLKKQEEIVRCKDFKHYMTIHCTCDGCCISGDWYCADGERN